MKMLCHVVYQVKDVFGDREFSVQWGPGVSGRLRRKVREMYGDPRFMHERIVILNITPLELSEVSPDQPVTEFSQVKVRVEQTSETLYELENGQVVTHRKGLFDEPDSFKVS